MAEFYRFFDSTLDDVREYTAEEFSEYFRMVLTNGVYNGGTNLQVAAGGGNMTVDIKDGYAMINGYLYKVAGGVTLTLANADVTYNRIDRIVLRWDIREESRFIKAMVIKGVASKSPVAPALTRNNEIYELSLAQVLVKAGTNFIAGSDVTDERLNTSVCGIFNSRIQADTTEIFSQFNKWYNEKIPSFEKEWKDWFSKQQLSGLVTKTELEACKTEVGATISSHVDETSRQSTVLQHGLSVINGDVTSPADIEVQGRTLTSLSNLVLESSKYYVLADKKTKLKWADSSVTTGVAKFTGKAEKPTVIRTANFEDKASSSTLENPHIAKRMGIGTTLLSPSQFTVELDNANSGTGYPRLGKLDGLVNTQATATEGTIAQHLFSFDLIEEVERNIGKIPGSSTSMKVQWLKDNLAKLTCNWHGYGSSVGGNKANLCEWSSSASSWGVSYQASHAVGTVSKLSKVVTNLVAIGNMIDSNGFVHFLAYTNATDGTTASTIYTDYVECEIQLKSTATLNSACVPLYEVDSDEYSKILGEWDENAVLSRYPKVEGTQHLQGIAMFAEGTNLLPPFTEWTLRDVAKVISPYEIELNATGAGQDSPVIINAMPSTTYTFNWEGNGITYVDSLKDGTLLKRHAERSTDKTITFTTADTANQIRIFLGNGNTASGKFTFKNPILTLGSTPKPFVPRNPSHLFADVKIGQMGTMKDMLYKQDGQWFVRKAIEKDVELDGSLAWSTVSSGDGYKRIRSNYKLSNAVIANVSTRACVKYDSSVLKSVLGFTGQNEFLIHPTDYDFNVTIPNIDSGWTESMTPTSNMIKGLANGWKYTGNGTTHSWVSVLDGTTTPTNQTEVFVASNKVSADWKGYWQLSYVITTPQIENVTDKIEGDIVVNGLTQVEVTSGVIVREKVTVVKFDSVYYTNWLNYPQTKFENRTGIIVSIHKNGVLDSNNWVIYTHNTANGKYMAKISATDYDPTAEYTVTYLALDRHQMTVNATEVKATYANNIRSALDDVVVKQSDVEIAVKTAYELAEQALQSTNDNKTKISQAETDIQEINDTRMLKVLKTNKDSEGIFKTVTYKRKSDNTIYCVSTLSGGTTPLYTTRTEKYYDATGKTVIATHVYTLSYDDDGELVSEV